MLKVVGAEHLNEDERFGTNRARMAHLDDLVAALTRLTKERTTDDWVARLDAARVPAGPVLSIAEMQRDPQAIARVALIIRVLPTLTHTPEARRGNDVLPFDALRADVVVPRFVAAGEIFVIVVGNCVAVRRYQLAIVVVPAVAVDVDAEGFRCVDLVVGPLLRGAE